MFTIYMTDVNHNHIELFDDKNHTLGSCRGKGNYIVRRADRMFYRIPSILQEYKRLKSEGYKVSNITFVRRG